MNTTSNFGTEKSIIIGLSLWASTIYVLGRLEVLAQIPNLIFGGIVISLFIGTSLLYFKSKSIYVYLSKFSLESLTFIHLWRIIAAAVFLAYGAAGMLPRTFVNLAGYGDLIAGLMVPVTLFFRQHKASFWIFNIIGFTDFLIAVGTGVFFAFSGDEIMLNIRLLPLAMIPLFGVPISGLIHIVMFNKLIAEAAANKSNKLMVNTANLPVSNVYLKK